MYSTSPLYTSLHHSTSPLFGGSGRSGTLVSCLLRQARRPYNWLMDERSLLGRCNSTVLPLGPFPYADGALHFVSAPLAKAVFGKGSSARATLDDFMGEDGGIDGHPTVGRRTCGCNPPHSLFLSPASHATLHRTLDSCRSDGRLWSQEDVGIGFLVYAESLLRNLPTTYFSLATAHYKRIGGEVYKDMKRKGFLGAFKRAVVRTT